jgi:hypothetical protein
MPFSPVSTSHFDKYAQLMARGMADKLFFADRLDADVFVDFGCADGTLLHALQTIKPDTQMVGYDLSDLATTRAAQKVRGTFFNEWFDLEDYLRSLEGKTIALIASSVVHEVYAYGGTVAGIEFWKRLNDGPFDHFILRDMALGIKDLTSDDPEIASRVRARANPRILSDFENRWGSIDLRRHLTHFLLKYSYTDNWVRELNEHYLPLTREEILDELSDNFTVDLASAEILPFLAGQVKQDFGIAFPCPTHFKLIMSRKP